MDLIHELGDWAWARHHNPLSWYVRPLFLLPWAFFAWRRSWSGLAVTLVALITSMAWFPAPAQPDPRVEAFLAAERAWLLGPWPVWKIALSLTAPLSLAALAAAFWKRSVRLGVALIIAIAAAKIGWSVFEGGDAGRAVALPATVGAVICTAGIIAAVRWRAARSR